MITTGNTSNKTSSSIKEVNKHKDSKEKEVLPVGKRRYSSKKNHLL